MMGASFINTLLSVLCVFLVPFTFLAAMGHVLWFFRWLLWVVSVSSSFTNSFKSSSKLLVGLPAFLRVLVEMMSPGVPLGSSSDPSFFTLWQFAWLDAISQSSVSRSNVGCCMVCMFSSASFVFLLMYSI